MNILSLITDEYENRARLRPALLVSLPLALGVASWLPDLSGVQVLMGIIACCGFTALLAQLGRDEGKMLEPQLFDKWGGKPTTQLLRHRNPQIDTATKKRYHDALNSLVVGVVMPSAVEEQSDPSAADAKYDSCVLYLREATRDKKAHPLLFAENVSYGFRRNLYGMKRAGVALSIASLAAAVLAAIVNAEANRPPAVASVATILNGLMLTWWCLRIRPDWIALPAFAYAERLLAVCDTLRSREAAPKQSIIYTQD